MQPTDPSERHLAPAGGDRGFAAASAPRSEQRRRDERRRQHRVLWVGGGGGAELLVARDAISRLEGCQLIDAGDEAMRQTPPVGGPAHSLMAADPAPDLVLLVSDRPGRWSSAAALGWSLRWPLVPILSVGSSLADGRRRSGPPLAGIEELSWHDAAGRLARWFADVEAGSPGSVALPPTVRREDRLLEAPIFSPHPRIRPQLPPVSVAARRPLDLEGIADLLAAVGHPVARGTVGRPELSPGPRLIVWDACRIDATDLEWLRMLAANRPEAAVVILDSFPRGDVARAAIQAGAAAVHGRPVALEALVGTLGRLAGQADTR